MTITFVKKMSIMYVQICQSCLHKHINHMAHSSVKSGIPDHLYNVYLSTVDGLQIQKNNNNK